MPAPWAEARLVTAVEEVLTFPSQALRAGLPDGEEIDLLSSSSGAVQKQVISCSRRTDVPGFYLPWLLRSLSQGWVDVTNPYNRKRTRVSLRPDRVHTLVLWSKNYGPALRRLRDLRAYRLFFIFTVNDCPDLEWNVPALPQRLEQVRLLAEEFGPQRVQWRYDPLIVWRRHDERRDNFSGLLKLAGSMAGLGLDAVVTSFAHPYNKVRRRMEQYDLELCTMPESAMIETAGKLAERLREEGIRLRSCCNDLLLGAEGVERAKCIDGALLAALAREPCSLQKDPGQRPECVCTRSVDIGSYEMACPHNCVYCYANPAIQQGCPPLNRGERRVQQRHQCER